MVNLVLNLALINANFTCQKLNTWDKLSTHMVKDPTRKDHGRIGILQKYKRSWD